MKKFFNTIKADKITLGSFVISLVLMIVSLCVIGIFYTSLPPFIPLFNQLPWGEARLGTRGQMFVPLSVALSVSVFNFFLSYKLYQELPLIARILCVTSLLVSFFVFLFVLRTIQIIV